MRRAATAPKPIASTGQIGAFTSDFAVDPTGVVGADAEVSASDDPGVTDVVDDADRAAIDAEGARTVRADGQVATDDDTTVDAEGARTVGADGQVTTPGGVGTNDDGGDGDRAAAADGADDS